MPELFRIVAKAKFKDNEPSFLIEVIEEELKSVTEANYNIRGKRIPKEELYQIQRIGEEKIEQAEYIAFKVWIDDSKQIETYKLKIMDKLQETIQGYINNLQSMLKEMSKNQVLEEGAVVRIYEFPATEEDFEGLAILVEKLGNYDDTLEHWRVRFLNGEHNQIVSRFVKKPST